MTRGPRLRTDPEAVEAYRAALVESGLLRPEMVEAATDEEILKTMTQIVTAMINFVAQAQQMYSVMAAVVQRFGEDLNATMDKVAKQWALIFERADRPEMVAEFNRFVGQRRGRG